MYLGASCFPSCGWWASKRRLLSVIKGAHYVFMRPLKIAVGGRLNRGLTIACVRS